MSRRTTVALFALGVALTACGSGRNAEVLKEHTSINGVNVNLANGDIQVRDVYATPTTPGQQLVPAGGSLALHFHVYNRADAADLMAASSPVVLAGPGVVGSAVTIGSRNNVTVGGPTGEFTATIPRLAQERWVGTYVSMTLAFANAGHVDLTVPIEDNAAIAS